jgi:hypothetical protein
VRGVRIALGDEAADLTIYRRFLLVLLTAVLCGQGVAFLAVNVGAAHFLNSGKPTLVTALHRLHGLPRRPDSSFLRTVPTHMQPGAVEVVPVGPNRFGGFFRVQAAYYLYPHKAYFVSRGSVESKIEHARSVGARYLILLRRSKAEAWPALNGGHEITGTRCCRLFELAAR